MIQTIVFATDLCVFTPYIAQHVLSLAENLKAKIVVVHAVEPLGSLGTAVLKTYLPKEADQELQNEGMGIMLATIKERLIDMLADEFLECNLTFNQVMDVVVEPGNPTEVILRCVEEKQADLIIMGTRSPNLVHSFSLGSVTSRVLQLAKVPVYTVPMLPKAPSAIADNKIQAR